MQKYIHEHNVLLSEIKKKLLAFKEEVRSQHYNNIIIMVVLIFYTST